MANPGKMRTDIQSVIETWRYNRRLHPGWVILPHSNRDALWERTRFWAMSIVEFAAQEDDATQVSWLFELAWRWDQCLLPWFDELTAAVDSIILKLEDERDKNPSNLKGISRRELAYLYVGLLRSFRENGHSRTLKLIEKVLPHGAYDVTDSIAPILYQRALYFLECWRLDEAFVAAQEPWPSADPIWKIRRAFLLAELGALDLAHELATTALQDARRAELDFTQGAGDASNPIAERAYAYSREGHARICLRYLNVVIRFRSGNAWTPAPDDRWEELGLYRANVQSEIETTRNRIETVSRRKNLPDSSRPFSSRRHFSFSVDDEPFSRSRGALEFARLVEESGLPPMIDSFQITIEDIRKVHNKLLEDFRIRAWQLAFRSRDAKLLQGQLNAGQIALASEEYIDSLYEKISGALSSFVKSKEQTVTKAVTSSMQECALILASQLSRRLSLEQKKDILLKILQLKSFPDGGRSIDRSPLINLIYIIARDTSHNEKRELAENILAIPFESEISPYRRTLLHAYDQFREKGSIGESPSWQQLSRYWVERLEDEAAEPETRVASLIRLSALYNNGLLLESLRSRIAAFITQENMQVDRWPQWQSHPDALKTFLEEVDEAKLQYIDHFSNLSITSMQIPKGGWRLGGIGASDLLTALDDNFSRPWSGADPSLLSPEEMPPHILRSCIAKIRQWWADEGRLIANNLSRESLAAAFFQRLQSAAHVIAYVLLPACGKETEFARELTEIAEGLAATLMPVPYIGPAVLAYGTDGTKANVVASIRHAMASHNIDQARAGIEGVLHWCALAGLGKAVPVDRDLVQQLGLVVQRRHPRDLLAFVLEVIEVLLERFPSQIEPLVKDLLIGLDYLGSEISYETIQGADGEASEQLFRIRKAMFRVVVLLDRHLSLFELSSTELELISKWLQELNNDPLLKGEPNRVH